MLQVNLFVNTLVLRVQLKSPLDFSINQWFIY